MFEEASSSFVLGLNKLPRWDSRTWERVEGRGFLAENSICNVGLSGYYLESIA